MVLLFLGSEIYHLVIVEVGNSVLHLSIRSLDESEMVNLCIYTERRDKSDVRTFRTLDRTQTTIVCIVNVTHLKSGTLTRQTARTKCRKTTLVCHLGQRVGLVHEL